ncbi:MAG: FAD-dependent oxidoreductase, partial [Lachnospiraceae bacterium]|nr:FAD-dependent oxidoreductase [Lachnospiraceae bacterium]
VNSSSEEGMLSVNGMSYSGRNGINANSAIVVTVTPDDYIEAGFSSYGVLSGMEFQRDLERKAFNECSGLIPCQTFKDFKGRIRSSSFEGVTPECKGKYASGDINNILPEYVCRDIIEAMDSYGKKIGSFDSDDTVLSGVESRTSSPVRINRNECFLSSVPGIFPSGEGAGYAGGIMSAAIDGLKCAEAVVKYAGFKTS